MQMEIEPGSHAFLRLHGCSALGFPSEGRIVQSKPKQWADTKGPNSLGLGFGMGTHAIRKGCSDVLLLWENTRSALTTAEDGVLSVHDKEQAQETLRNKKRKMALKQKKKKKSQGLEPHIWKSRSPPSSLFTARILGIGYDSGFQKQVGLGQLSSGYTGTFLTGQQK